MTSNSIFAGLVVKAGRAFVAAKGKDPEVEGAELAKILESEQPLSRQDRKMLAELVTGQWRKRAGRAEVAAGKKLVIEVVAAYRAALADSHSVKKAKSLVGELFGISHSTIDNYVKITEDRERAVEKAKSAVSNPNK